MDPTRGIRRVFKRLAAREARRQEGEAPAEVAPAGQEAEKPGPSVDQVRPPVGPQIVKPGPSVGSGPRLGEARSRPAVQVRPRHGGAAGRGRRPGAAFDEAVMTRRRQAEARSAAGASASASASAGQMGGAGQGRAAAPAAVKTPGLQAAFEMGNLDRAWLHIKANGGGPGVDGVSLEHFAAHAGEELAGLRQDVLSGVYRPTPVKTVWVPKRSGEGMRPLAKWTIRDRVAQRAVVEYLEPTFERRFLDCSFGFRPGRGVQDAAARILMLRDQGLRWVVDADIKKCFERIDPTLLIKRLREELSDPGLLWLLEGWVQVHIMNALAGQRPTAGTSQGGPISPLLANIYLHPLDVKLTQAKLNLVRYADDLVVLCPRRQDAEAALAQVEDGLRELRLELNPKKTRLVSFDEGFQFLGVFFIGNKHHYLGF